MNNKKMTMFYAFLQITMDSTKSVHSLKKCLEASTANCDPLGIATFSDLLGDAYESKGKYKTAIEYYKKSLEIRSEIGNLSGRIKSNLDLADTHYKLSQYHPAIQYCKTSLEISTNIREPSGIACSNCLLGAFIVALESIKKQSTVSKKV